MRNLCGQPGDSLCMNRWQTTHSNHNPYCNSFISCVQHPLPSRLLSTLKHPVFPLHLSSFTSIICRFSTLSTSLTTMTTNLELNNVGVV